jgi:hypothetical protein
MQARSSLQICRDFRFNVQYRFERQYCTLSKRRSNYPTRRSPMSYLVLVALNTQTTVVAVHGRTARCQTSWHRAPFEALGGFPNHCANHNSRLLPSSCSFVRQTPVHTWGCKPVISRNMLFQNTKQTSEQSGTMTATRPAEHARHCLSRRIASTTYGVPWLTDCS